jgi:hypothetical protein
VPLKAVQTQLLFTCAESVKTTKNAILIVAATLIQIVPTLGTVKSIRVQTVALISATKLAKLASSVLQTQYAKTTMDLTGIVTKLQVHAFPKNALRNNTLMN